MRIIAITFIMVFSLVQAVPAIQALVNPEQVSLFLVDEEKNNTKEDSLKEIKKDFSLNQLLLTFSHLPLLSYKKTGEIFYASHTPESLTPPPNC